MVIYLGALYVPPGGENQPGGPTGKPTVEMPLSEVIAAIASREGVSQDSVEVYFCVLAEDVENENFAAGVVVNNQKSIVLIYDNATGTITLENEYTATTSDELQAMSVIALKDIVSPFAQDSLGHSNANKIVPFEIIKVGNTYEFNYYDGYSLYISNNWGYGRAVIDESGQLLSIAHSWIE